MSFFVQRTFRSSTSTMAAVSHMFEMAASSTLMLSRLGWSLVRDALTGFLYEPFDHLLHPAMRLPLNLQGFQAELLAPDPAHDRGSYKDAFFDRQFDGQGTRLANL